MTSFATTDPRLIRHTNYLSSIFIPPQEFQGLDPPSIARVGKASFELFNVPISLLIAGTAIGEFDPNFMVYDYVKPANGFDEVTNPFRYIQGYEDFLQSFLHARNEADVERIKVKIDRELENRFIISQRPVISAVTSFAAGVMDPIIFVPGGAVARLGQGISAARTARNFALASGSIVAVQEMILKAAHEAEPEEEAPIVIGLSMLLGGAIGGVVGRSRALRLAADQLNTVNRMQGVRAQLRPESQLPKPDPFANHGMQIDRTGLSGLSSADEIAIALAKENPELVGMGAPLRRTLQSIAPWLQAHLSKNADVRFIAERMMETPLVPEGAQQLTVQVQARLEMSKTRNVLFEGRNNYVRYRTGNPKATMGVFRTIAGFRQTPGKITLNEFMDQVTIARVGQEGPDGTSLRVDEHPIPEVAATARLYSENIYTPHSEEAVRVKLLPPEILKKKGHLNRLYNDKLKDPAEQAKFVDAVVEAKQKNALLRGTLEEFDEASARQGAWQTVRAILSIPEGRMLPGEASFRTPMIEQLLDVHDSYILPWLVTNAESRAIAFTRTYIPDNALTSLGLFKFSSLFSSGDLAGGLGKIPDRGSLIQKIRAAPDRKAASKILRKRYAEILRRAEAGSELVRSVLRGDKAGLKAGDTIILVDTHEQILSKILKSATHGEAENLLKLRDDALIRDFSTGDLRFLFDKLETKHKAAVDKILLTDHAAAEKLRKEHLRDVENLRLGRDVIRGVLNVPKDPAALAPRIMRGMRQTAFTQLSGNIFLSSLPDSALILMNRGMMTVWRDVFGPLITDFKGFKMGIEQANAISGPAEFATNITILQRFEIEESFAARTRLESGLNKSVHALSLANLSAFWNTWVRNVSSLTANGMIIRGAIQVAGGGKLSRGQRLRLNELGLNDTLLKRIAVQYAKHGAFEGRRRAFAPNASQWDDPTAVLAISAAVDRANNLDLIRGSALDRPLARVLFQSEARSGTSEEIRKLFTMFMNFAFAASTRVLGRAVQLRDAQVMNALIFGVGVGAVSQYLKIIARGGDPNDLSYAEWVRRSVAQTGFTGILFDMDEILDQVTMGNASISAIFRAAGDETGGRYYSPGSMLSAVTGPAVSQAAKVLLLAPSYFADLELTDSEARQLRRLIPLQNHFLLTRMIRGEQPSRARRAQ